MDAPAGWVETPVWSALTTPLMAADAPGITPLSVVGGVAVLVVGWWLARLARRHAVAYAARHPTWPDDRVATGLQAIRGTFAVGTTLTALRVVGLSLDTLGFVWALFNAPLLVVAGTEVSVVTILTVALVVFAGFRISDLIQRGVQRWARRRDGVDEGNVGTAQRLLHYVVVGLSIVIAMQTIGINLDALLTAGAVFAVGFGLAMQSIAQNFVSGVILLLEQSIRPGDVVEVSGKVVRVEEMAVRSTVVVTLDGDRHIVPNSALVQSSVRNLTMTQRPVRAHTRVGVAYHLDPDAVVRVLETAAATIPGRLAEEPPVVLFDKFGENALEFDVFVWIEEPWRLPDARAALNHRIWAALKAHDMPIPYPQRTVHLAQPPRVAEPH